MRKFLPLTIVLVLFLSAGCTIKDNNPFSNQNNLSNIDNELITINDDFKNENDNNDDNEITRWEDKNFEALIRSYLDNFDEDIYFKDLDDITELEIRSYAGVTTNIKQHAVPQEDWDKVGELTSMKDIDNFNNLKKIALWSSDIEAVHVYKNCLNVEYLDLSHNNITDISNISKYNNLTHFDISDNYVADLKPLGSLTALKELTLSNIGQRDNNYISGCIESEVDIDDIDDLKSLEFLHIENSNISNVSKLNNLSNLEILNLYTCNIDTDKLLLSNCYKLEDFYFSFYNRTAENIAEKMVLDINKFDDLVNLKSLGLSNVFLSKKQSFSNLNNIESLYLSDVEVEDIGILESLSNLKNIYLADVNIESLKYLKNNTKLKSISITYGNLSDISDLKSFPDVENLKLTDNKITDISVLTQLNKLKKVIVFNNPIIDNSIIDELKKREGITIN